MPVGAEVIKGGGVHFRVWAPRRRKVAVAFEEGTGPRRPVELAAEEGGYFSGHIPDAGAGARYRFRLDSDDWLYPDPASRAQPEGPHGPSEVVDPGEFRWTDGAFQGASLRGQVLYELHVGTFTPEGTFEAAARELPELAAAGITAVELMPVADFPGRFGWGYDGVCLFAPCRLYGAPDDLRRLVDRAHALGLSVILDVVYNHLGPDGNYLGQFSEHYFTERHHTDWGAAIDFDGPCSGPVRELFAANAGYWIDEYHFDGLRLDATQNIYDGSEDHILAVIARRVRAAGRGRGTLVFAENEDQEARLVRAPERGGLGLDGAWNDDFHHSARAAATGRNPAYYRDHRGSAQELLSAVKWGYLFQGQRAAWRGERRGTPALDIEPARFVHYLENHDQVANSLRGARLHQLTSPGRYRALAALLLLGPETPLLFQGQEFAASAPFVYFADHEPELAAKVREGRAEGLGHFAPLGTPEARRRLPDPGDPGTFARCKLDLSERARHAEAYALHRDLLALRRGDPGIAAQEARGVDGAVIGAEAFALRYFGDGGEDRLLVVNLGLDLGLSSVPEPLVAPPEGARWEVLWSSEDPRYGGEGTPPVETDEGLRVPGHAAVLLRPVR
ncbi:MAG: malto-oligosyltrehalose trehalohydrolase [Polyangiaceae bacterium]|nr:malto-oligosyltrehalose trehalohydrolase [Polyangiaceae bacterium]